MRRAEDSAPYHLATPMKPFLLEQSDPSAARTEAEGILTLAFPLDSMPDRCIVKGVILVQRAEDAQE